MLTPRQIEAFTKLNHIDNGIVWWKIGEGKTRIALAWASQRMHFNVDKALVVCSPNAFRQWQDEAILYGFTRLQFLSYGELQTREMRVFDLVNIKCVIVDELWLFKNPKSTRSKNLHKLTTSLPTLGLSGSLVTARNIEDLFGQAYAVNAHKSLAKSLTEFRTQFCVSADNFGGLKFWAKAGALETIQKRLAPYVDIYFPPPERETKVLPITVNPTSQQQKHLTDVNQEYFTILDSGELEIRSAAVLISKVQQISDGAILDSQGRVTHVPSNKLQRSVELCHQLTESNQRVLVWCAFKASVDLLVSCLGKTATSLSSHTDFDFEGWAKGRYQFCVATIGSGASLNDFANVQYAIIYSAPYNHRAVQQALGRTNRKGSQHSVAYYYMMQTDQTVDASVYRNLKLTSDIEQSIISTSTQVVQQYMQHYSRLAQGGRAVTR